MQRLFAENMRRIRLEKRLTQEKVAEAANLHVNYIGSVERAERNISIQSMARIASALGVSASVLLMTEQELLALRHCVGCRHQCWSPRTDDTETSFS